MINNLEEIKEHLASGGVVFVFPEGTRSRDGNLAPFQQGRVYYCPLLQCSAETYFYQRNKQAYSSRDITFLTLAILMKFNWN